MSGFHVNGVPVHRSSIKYDIAAAAVLIMFHTHKLARARRSPSREWASCHIETVPSLKQVATQCAQAPRSEGRSTN